MATRGQLTVDTVNFLNAGDNFLTLTATSDGVGTFTSNSTGTVKLTGITYPTVAADAANKAYVDAIAISGASWKNSVACSTTSSGTLATSFAAGQTVDGVTLVTGDRILIKNQGGADPGGSHIDNGTYTVNASGAPTRATDLPTGVTAAGAAVWINDGTINGDKGYICTDDPGDAIVGTHALEFTNFSSAPNIAGANTQVQFNNDGLFGASSNFTWDGTTLTGSGAGGISDGTFVAAAGAVSGVTTLGMSGELTNSALGVTFSHASNDQTITKTGTGDLTLVSAAAVVVEDVIFDTGAVSAVTTIGMSGELTNSALGVTFSHASNDQTIEKTGTGDLTLVSAAAVVVEDVIFDTGAVSAVTTIGMSGELTNSALGVTFSHASNDQTIEKTGTGDLTLVSAAAVVVEDVIFDTGAVSAVTTIGMSGELTNSALGVTFSHASNDQTIEKTGTGDLTLVSAAAVVVEDVIFDTGAVSAVTTIGMSGNLTNSAGNVLLTNAGAQNITKSGSGALNIINSNATSDTVIKMGDSAAATNVIFRDSADAAVMTVTSDRTVESTSTTTGTVQIVGGLGVTLDISANAINCTSDATLKTKIVQLGDPMSTLGKIEGYSYEWIRDEGTGKEMWGVLAQQLESVGLNHMVTQGTDHKSVNYIQLIPLLIEAVKELSYKIDILESK
jgi:hypothetical protein